MEDSIGITCFCVAVATIFITLLVALFSSGSSGGHPARRRSALKERVERLDFARIRAKAASRNGWSETRVADAEREYRRFLFLAGKHRGQEISPWSQDLDLFWHEHMLDTRRYAQDCDAVLGFFLHHDPHVDADPERARQARERTAAYRDEQFVSGGDSTVLCASAGCVTESHAHCSGGHHGSGGGHGCSSGDGGGHGCSSGCSSGCSGGCGGGD